MCQKLQLLVCWGGRFFKMVPTSEDFNTGESVVGSLTVIDSNISRLLLCVTIIEEAVCIFSVITLEVTGCLYRIKNIPVGSIISFLYFL